MGAPANSVWLPLMLMVMMISMATAQSNDTSANSNAMDDSISTTSIAPDLVVSGDLSKGARVEQLSSELEPNMVSDESAADANGGERNPNANPMSTPKSTEGQYDVIDVMAATSAGVGKPKSGQTTRIYTTGDVNDDFWLKHLGDDFKHAIHLQVGGTNDDYNRIINQTSSGGVHEEVHHEYLPGAERPPEVQQQQQHQQQQQQQQFAQPNLISQLSLDGEAMALKQNYLRQQEQLRYAQANGYATQHSSRYTHNNNNNRRMQSQQQHTHTYVTHQQQQQQPELHQHQHSHQQLHQHQHSHTRTRNKSRHSLRNRYKQQQQQPPPSSIINSSEDTLHAAQSQATPTSAASPNSSRGSSLRGDDAAHNDNPLPFKSPFNDYGSRPTRDLTYLLYKRGL